MLSNYFVQLITAALLLLLVSDEVKLQIVATTKCPEKFVRDEANLINCTIYGDNIMCSPAPTKIQIELTKDGNTGVSADPDYPLTCDSQVRDIPNGEAKCTQKEGNIYSYVYKFMDASETKQGDTLQCKVPCFGITPDIGNACEIQFEVPVSKPFFESEAGVVVIVIIVLCVCGLVAVGILLVLHFAFHFKGQWKRKCSCCC